MTQHVALGPEIGADHPELAEVVRSGFKESWHRGAIVAVGPDGSVLRRPGTGAPMRAGTADVPMFPRSSNKPM